MTVYDLPHIASIRAVGNPVVLYRITMEEGYWIHMEAFGENVWKQATAIYPNDDLTQIQILAEADLPEGADMCGNTNNEEVM